MNWQFAEDKLSNDAARSDLLAEFHAPLQKVALFVVMPILLVTYGAAWAHHPSINNLILMLCTVAMSICWIMAVVLRGELSVTRAVYVFGLPLVLFQGAEMMLTTQNEGSNTLSLIVVSLYMSVYTMRHLLVSLCISFFFIFASEAYKWMVASEFVDWWTIQSVEAGERLIGQVGFSGLILVFVWLIIKKNRHINDILFIQVAAVSDDRQGIIRAAERMQPILVRTTNKIEEISTDFVSQAAAHASSVTEVNRTVHHIGGASEKAAKIAERTFVLSSAIQYDVDQGIHELKVVQSGFAEVGKKIDESKRRLEKLSANAQNIESILRYNQEIGEHIKVLAVNASIEAASAGDAGRGFLVVANELGELIGRTEENLDRSSDILSRIRKEAKQSTDIIHEGAQQLSEFFIKLTNSTDIVQKLSSRFVVASEYMGSITESTHQQRSGIKEVSVALGELNKAAIQLESGSSFLLDAMADIKKSNDALKIILIANKSEESFLLNNKSSIK